VLDVACGIGLDAVALARRGADVTAADASAAMLARAESRVAVESAGERVRLVRSTWHGLADALAGETFDVVVCLGNSVAHLRNGAEMTTTFETFHQLLAPGGRLVIDSHDWDALVELGDRVIDDPVVVRRGDQSCVRRYVWRYTGASTTTLDLTIHLDLRGGHEPGRRAWTVRLHPFPRRVLIDSLDRAGFGVIDVDAPSGDDRYTVVATRS
jgi:SAM-dependent methyltransferase